MNVVEYVVGQDVLWRKGVDLKTGQATVRPLSHYMALVADHLT